MRVERKKRVKENIEESWLRMMQRQGMRQDKYKGDKENMVVG